ncbi:hypothetical protein EMCRGX_G026363 [Ephydatia muelleri]
MFALSIGTTKVKFLIPIESCGYSFISKVENIHFLCTSDSMSALDMANPIADELILLESSGLEVYDALHNEHVLVIAPILLFIADNPIASQLLNHLGGSAIKYGRICMADRDESLDVISTKRTLQDSLQQMVIIEDSNPLLHIPGDAYRCFPLELLNTLLLGPVKGTAKSLLALSKVFRIAYCDFFDPAEADTLQQTCVGFVHAVRDFMPSLLRKQKIHYFLHLVESMENYGPTSAYSAERCESFISSVHLQNIYGNKQAPSRDIAKHFATVEHLCYICGGGLFNSNERLDI